MKSKNRDIDTKCDRKRRASSGDLGEENYDRIKIQKYKQRFKKKGSVKREMQINIWLFLFFKTLK